MNTRAVLLIHKNDNVAVALRSLAAGERVKIGEKSVIINKDIPAKHSIALQDMPVASPVIMHGILVGETTCPVKSGERLGTHNLVHKTTGFSYRGVVQQWTPPDVSALREITFRGYMRKNGSVGTANNWIVAPLVFCENENILKLKKAFEAINGLHGRSRYRQLADQLSHAWSSGTSEEELKSLDFTYIAESTRLLFPNVDGIKFLTHESGCGGTRKDAHDLCALLAGYITHPNTAGATILSLGCQNAQIQDLQEVIHARDPQFDKPLYILDQQQYGSGESMLDDAVRRTFAGLVEANKAERQSVLVNKLVIGVECGGSDGFSGITANPLMGRIADRIAAIGGSVILGEFPEFGGAEQSLIDRCVDKEAAERFIKLYRDYETRANSVGAGFDMNPSPGNIREGLITDAMKSAGAVTKGGTSPVTDVLDYPGYVTKAGLNLLLTPGNDVESTTALVAAGANLVLFSTGLGTPTGNPIVPVIKIASNTQTARRMTDIIDFDAGVLIDGEKSMEALTDELILMLIKTAGGEYTPKAVLNHQDDFIPWKRDVSL